jgi:hypothetical protein
LDFRVRKAEAPKRDNDRDRLQSLARMSDETHTTRVKREMLVMDEKPCNLCASDDALVCQDELGALVRLKSIESRPRTGDSRPRTGDSMSSSRQIGSDVNSMAQTKEWVTAGDKGRRGQDSSSTLSGSLDVNFNSAVPHENNEEQLLRELFLADAAFDAASKKERQSPANSAMSLLNRFGRFAGLLFRRDQKIKPSSPRKHLTKLASPKKIVVHKMPEASGNDEGMEVKEELDEVAGDDDDDEAFGSADEDWRREIEEELDDEDEVGYNEDAAFGSGDSAVVLAACDPSALMDYTLMLENMQEVLEMPLVQDSVFEDEPEDVLVVEDVCEEENGQKLEEETLSADPLIGGVIDFTLAPKEEQSVIEFEADRLNLNAFINEAHASVDKAATREVQIRRLQSYLTKRLGGDRFSRARGFLLVSENSEMDEDALLFELERILNVEGLKFLDELFTLISLESERDKVEMKL